MMSFGADLSQVLGLAQDLAGAAVQSDANIAHAIDVVAPKILAEQIATAPERTGDLKASLDIDRTGPAEAHVGAVKKEPAGWRAHFIENGTARMTPRPFIRPAGDKYAPEFARTVLRGPFFKR